MSIGVGEISRRANAIYLGFLFIDCFQYPGIEYRRLCPWIDSNKQDDISILDTLDLRIEQEI